MSAPVNVMSINMDEVMRLVPRQVSEATTAAGREQALTAELRQQLSAANADAARQVLLPAACPSGHGLNDGMLACALST